MPEYGGPLSTAKERQKKKKKDKSDGKRNSSMVNL